MIFGIETGGMHKAYFEDAVIENAPFDDPVGDTVIRVERGASGLVTFTDLADGSVLAKERDFWFAWYAFYPDTDIYALDRVSDRRDPIMRSASAQVATANCRFIRDMHYERSAKGSRRRYGVKRVAIIATALVVMTALALGAMNL